MNNIYTKYIFFLVLILGFIMVVEANKIPPIDWSENFETKSKTPFGLYVLNNELDDLLTTKQKVKRTNRAYYEVLTDLIEIDSAKNTNIVLITGENEDYLSINNLALEYVNNGNNIFMFSAFYNYSDLLDTLGLRTYHTQTNYSAYNYLYNGFDDNVVTLTDPKLSKLRFTIKSPLVNSFFIPDSLRAHVEVLGYGIQHDTLRPNFIKVPYGKGVFYLNSNPYSFTNLNLLESNNHLYTESVLSYLDNNQTYLLAEETDIDDDDYEDSSMFSFIFNNTALRWAWYLTLIGLVLFVFFNAKRKQRIVPIIKPLENTTVEFTQTISSLYKNQEDYKGIINKSIIYTLEKIRREYFIDTTNLDEIFVANFQRKSGKKKEDIEAFVRFVKEISINPHLASANNLITLNKLIEKIVK